MTLGSGDSDSYTYDANTGRMSQYQFIVGGASDTGALAWNANGSLAQLAVTDTIPGSNDTQTCVYSHDDLGRLSEANCGTGFDQKFTLDAFGNLAPATRRPGWTSASASPTTGWIPAGASARSTTPTATCWTTR